jgi:hypothetical protein
VSLADGLASVDSEACPAEALEQLSRLAPQPDEAAQLRALPLEGLRDVEAALWQLSRVPELEKRLRMLRFAHRLSELEASLLERLSCLKSAVDAARVCEPLHQLLGVCLSVGNYVNMGFVASEAAAAPVGGFKLDCLLTLGSFQQDGASLLHVALLHLARLLEDTGEFPRGQSLQIWGQRIQEELSSLPKAAKEALGTLDSDIRELNAEAAFLKVEAHSSDGNELGKCVLELVRRSETITAAIVSSAEDVKRSCFEFCSFFAEKVNGPADLSEKTQALLKTLVSLSFDICPAGIDNLKKARLSKLPTPSQLRFERLRKLSIDSCDIGEAHQDE